MEADSILPFYLQMVNGQRKKDSEKNKKHIDILPKAVHNKRAVSAIHRYSFDQIIQFSVIPPVSGRDFRVRWMKGKGRWSIYFCKFRTFAGDSCGGSLV